MRNFLLILILLKSGICFAQNENMQAMAFPITDYITKLNDSVQLVQVQMPDGLSVKEKAVGMLTPKRLPGDNDTINIGYGRCQLIKGDYYYFAITVNKKSRSPQKGDLLYITLSLPNFYDGVLFKVLRHSIDFLKIEETPLVRLNDVIFLKDKNGEKTLIDSIVAEVKYTAETMIAQNDNQDMLLTKGVYKDKQLFATMLTITNADVINFLEYIIARPSLYAGHEWKFSETFATWMMEGAPTLVKEQYIEIEAAPLMPKEKIN